MLKLYKNNYYQVSITVQGKSKAFKIHRLVAKAFLLNVENKPYVNHKDGNKLNNNLSNLEWCTAKENTLHAIKAGLIDTSNNYLGKYNAKLNEKEVKEIRLRLIEKQKQRDRDRTGVRGL